MLSPIATRSLPRVATRSLPHHPRVVINGRCSRSLASLAKDVTSATVPPPFTPPPPAAAGAGVGVETRTASQWAAFGKQHVTAGLGRVRDSVYVKGKGLDLWTAEGDKILDFSSGIGVLSLGHCHPAVSNAVHAQVDTLTHLQCSIGFHQPYLELIEKLQPIMPHASLDSFFFWNSGSEAIEAAIKLARKATGRPNIISMVGGYHGRTYGAGAISRSKNIYTVGAGSLMPSTFSTPFPYWHSLSMPPSTSEEELTRIAIAQLDLVLRQQSAPKDTAAIFIEPVIGEGGYVPAPPAYLRHLRKVCDEHGILLVVDEVQCGFGRTGKMFALEHTPGVRPDVLVFAKGVANGYPLSGIVSTRELMGRLDTGSFGGTYAGNVVACAAASAVMDVFASEDILGNVKARGAQLHAGLAKIAKSSSGQQLIVESRGQELMAAIEFRTSDPLTQEGVANGTSIPSNIGKRIQDKCLEAGLLLLTTSCFDVIRFIPSLTVSAEQIDLALDIFTKAVDTVAREG